MLFCGCYEPRHNSIFYEYGFLLIGYPNCFAPAAYGPQWQALQDQPCS